MNLSRSITGALALAASLLVSVPATAEMTLDPGTSVTFHHHDLLGSPVMVSDHKGRVLWYENTKPYGEGLGKKSSSGLGHLDNTVSEATSNLGYTGHTVDSSTGLVYMKARHYDPVIGRFYSNDPVGFIASNPMMFNRYAYANNNPYTFVDPDGREGENTTNQDNWEAAGLPKPENQLEGTAADIGEAGSKLADAVDGELTDPINLIPGAAGAKSLGLFASILSWFGKSKKADLATDASNAIGISKKGVKHMKKHLKDFKALDPEFTIEQQIDLGIKIASNPNNFSGSANGSKTYKAFATIGESDYMVVSVLNASGNLRTVYPVTK